MTIVAMTLQRLFRQDDGASPVVGIILLVGITIILGAVFAVFVLDIGESTENNTPKASFSFSEEPCEGVRVTYQSGDAVNGDRVYFTGAAMEYNKIGSVTNWAGKDLEAGDSVIVEAIPGEKMRVNWDSEVGGSSAVLADFKVPETFESKSATASVVITEATVVGEDEVIFDLDFSGTSSVYVVGDSPQMEPVGRTLSKSDPSWVYDYEQSGGKQSTEEYRFGIGKVLDKNERANITVYQSSDMQCKLASDSALADD
jgi:FlaG/FlaF family flagellin (archaellin)